MVPFALGSLVGLLLALTGAGGGILAVPLRVFALPPLWPRSAKAAASSDRRPATSLIGASSGRLWPSVTVS